MFTASNSAEVKSPMMDFTKVFCSNITRIVSACSCLPGLVSYCFISIAV
jgi:hypothetical protein